MTEPARDRYTVLVVDDFEDARYMLRMVLEAKGLRVLEAADGEEAVSEAQRQCPDLILMDLNMPRMDGLEAVRRVRQCQEACRDVGIVALTAYDFYGSEEEARAAGCNAYLRKPLDFDELDRALRRLLPGYPPTGPLTPPGTPG